MKVILALNLFLFSISSIASVCDEGRPLSIFRPKYARHFSISYFKNYKIITVDKYKYFLSNTNLDCDTAKLVLKIPAHKVVMTSTTYLPALEILKEENALVGFQNKKYIVSKVFNLNKIKEISYKFNPENLLTLKADLIMGYEANYLNEKQGEVFKKLKLPVVINKDFEETSPLARAEWIVFIASFFDLDKKAVEVFKSIENDYLKLKSENEKRVTKTTVLVGDIQNGSWITCGGKSDLAQMIYDAGGILAYNRPSSATQNVSLEEVGRDKTTYDIWLPHNNWKTLETKKDKRYQFINAKKVFNNNQITNEYMANDYWEMGMQRPDLLLLDLVAIFHPEDYKGHKLHWYHQL